VAKNRVGRSPGGRKGRVTVLNPMGYPPQIMPTGMAPRPGTLQGKTVYLVDCRFDDSDILLEQMQAWFREHMAGVNTVFVHKSGVYTEDDPALFQEIREKGDAAIVGVGH
jgi:hypothetical protein